MLIGLLLAVTINNYCTFAEPFDRIYRNDVLTELPSEDTSNYEDYYVHDSTYNNKNEKRDIIKGPSLFSKIDASTADSDLALENDEVTGHSDLSRYYDKPKYSIEDKLDNIDSWTAPGRSHLSGLPHVHKKKSYVDGAAPHFHDERPSKKSSFPRHKHLNYEDVPDEVIKALYNWQIGDSNENAAKKSILTNNSADVSSVSSKPYITDDGLSADENENAESVTPEHGSKSIKKRRKINVLVNLKIKEAPGRRSGVGSPHRIGSSLITLSTETEMPQKRHFPYFYHQRRRHRIHHVLVAKKTLGEDAGSAEGSGSGAGEHQTSEDKSEHKLKLTSGGESDDSEASGSGYVPTTPTIQQVKLSVDHGDVGNDTTQSANNTTTTASRVDDVKNRNVKEGEGTDTNDGPSDQEGSGEQVEEKKSSSAEQHEGEVHKTDVEVNEKTNVVASNPSPAPVESDESMNKQADISNTDGTDNMKKKSGQEDKYETLEEVREKFKKWESNIIQSPSEHAPVDENSNAATKSAETVNADTKSEENHDAPVKPEENSKLIEKSEENSKLSDKFEENNKLSEKAEENDKSSEKAEEGTKLSEKDEESTKLSEKADESTKLSEKADESTKLSEKADESTKLSEKVEENNKLSEKVEESTKLSEKAEENSKLNEKAEEDSKLSAKSDESNNLPIKSGESSNLTGKQQETNQPTKLNESTTSVTKVAKNNSSQKTEENNSSGKRDESNTTSTKSDEINSATKAKVVDDSSSSLIKTNDLASGILITEKDGGEDEPQHLIKEKQPDDFVKELIGIPTKKLILKEKDDTKAVTKLNQESKVEKETEDAKLLSKLEKAKSSDEAEEKFNIEEVNKKNKEHHDIPDSDMKEGVHSLNSSDVAGFENQVSSSDEGPSPENTTSGLTTMSLENQDSTEEKPSSVEDKPSLQLSKTEEKTHFTTEQHPVKQTLMAETKTIKHVPEAELVTKEVKEVKKQSTEKETSSKHTSAFQRKKKISETSGDENESNEFVSSHEKAALANPLITKEANEFSNEQEKSFASAIEKIKAQEEKLKGKEIDNEIQETLSPSKKHSANSPQKKGESNIKQLKVYRHQILSEVKKIDDLISEYHKDGHSTKELSEAKIVLQNDLNLVKELEKNTKKKTIKKEKVKESERLQVMPSSAYLSSSNDENKEEMAHRGKSALDSKSTTKSLEREAERSEKQLEEYYFHTGSKSSIKHTKKPSLEEIHKLLKAEIKSLRQKKNGKADSQLKNIRKLVQQHLKKLISTGDIDKSAFHSLAPEIRQLGELLKERIKSLKKKKTAHNAKVKSIKANSLTQTLKSGNKKANELFDQSMEAQVSTNEIKGGKVKTDRKSHHLAVEPKIGILEPSLENVKGVESPNKPEMPGMAAPSSEKSSPPATSSVSSVPPEATKEHKDTTLNETMILSALGSKAQSTGGADTPPGMNIRNLLNTLNEKLGAVYNNAKNVNDMAQKISQPETPSAKEQAQVHPDIQQQAHHNTAAYEQPIPGLTAGTTQRYVAQKPMTGVQTVSANVPTPTNMQLELRVQPAGNAQVLPASESRSDYPQQQNADHPQPVSPPQVVDATESTATATTTNSQQVMENEASNAMHEAMPAAQSTTVPEQESQANETPAPQAESHQETAADNKENLPMVPDEPEFEEDNTEALASLEPINTLVETLEKDITEIWSYKDLYPNAEALGLDNEKVHNTYANLGSLSGLSLRRALNRALRGEDVGLGIVGGSISKGGPFSEKGLEYVLRSYFYAIEDYWNKVIRPVTGSSMIVRDVSLGGISTDYYSFCIRNHLPDDKLTNIVLWELSANDMRRYDDSLKPKPQPLEQFTRNILSYRAKPSLIFVNFFALFDWDPDLRANCRNFEDEGEDDVAKYYKITSLSWRNMVCPLLKSETSPIFTRNNLFAEDHFHPSILGHAQMSYIIIDYIRTEFLKNLVKMRPFFIGDAVEKLQIPRSIYMPRPMFKETFLWKPLCYTYMLVDNRLPNNTMPLHEENESDFKYTVVRGFKIRSDKIAGMETKLKDQFIRYKLQIPRHEDGGIQPFKQLGIMSFTDDRYAEVQFDSQHPSRLEAKKRFLEGTVVKTIAENIEPGEHTLTVRSGDIGFLICALVLG